MELINGNAQNVGELHNKPIIKLKIDEIDKYFSHETFLNISIVPHGHNQYNLYRFKNKVPEGSFIQFRFSKADCDELRAYPDNSLSLIVQPKIDSEYSRNFRRGDYEVGGKNKQNELIFFRGATSQNVIEINNSKTLQVFSSRDYSVVGTMEKNGEIQLQFSAVEKCINTFQDEVQVNFISYNNNSNYMAFIPLNNNSKQMFDYKIDIPANVILNSNIKNDVIYFQGFKCRNEIHNKDFGICFQSDYEASILDYFITDKKSIELTGAISYGFSKEQTSKISSLIKTDVELKKNYEETIPTAEIANNKKSSQLTL